LQPLGNGLDGNLGGLHVDFDLLDHAVARPLGRLLDLGLGRRPPRFFLALGIIGELVGDTHDEAQHRQHGQDQHGLLLGHQADERDKEAEYRTDNGQ